MISLLLSCCHRSDECESCSKTAVTQLPNSVGISLHTHRVTWSFLKVILKRARKAHMFIDIKPLMHKFA